MSDTAQRLASALSDRYRIERQLGEGGMATVYLARDLKHSRDVAVKVLKPEVGDAIGAARFQREIELVARLTHPHIVPLHDSGEADGLRYFVMPVITGGSLADLIGGPLPPTTVADHIRTIAAGLDYAHGQGVVHRDLKPSNVLLHEGEVLIADLGIAFERGDATDARVTQTGSSLGTPAYMSPEQLDGSGEVDARSDVYSLGCIAFEMLTGQRPFNADSSAALAAKVLTEAPPEASKVGADVSASIDPVLRKAMAKKPAGRFDSAGEFARELAAALAPSTTTSRRATALAVAVVSVIVAGFLWQTGSRRGRDIALAAVAVVDSLVEAGDRTEAYIRSLTLTHPAALEALEPSRSRFSQPVEIVTDPSGATVSVRRYASPDDAWIELGVTPLDTWMASAVTAVRFEREGYEPVEANRDVLVMGIFGGGEGTPLLPLGSTPPGMVHVPPGVVDLGSYAAGLWGLEPLALGAFFIDVLEVTNGDYEDFVAAGGYEDAQYWPAEMEAADGPIAPEQIAQVFVDQTGQPGPATWELGAPPEGQADHPVTGISWYEARAYARFVGKRLPTIYHWQRAVGGWMGELVLPRSNIGSTGTVPVGSTAAESEFGLRDVAGNAREWVANTDGELPLALGGGWNDDATKFFDATTSQAPWERGPSNGVRLMAEPDDTTGMVVADAPIDAPRRDFYAETPVGDAEFAIYRNLFTYDDVELDARVEATDTTPEWIRQEVTFETGFPAPSRMKIHVFLPLDYGPDTEVVVFFPGSGVLRTTQPLEEIAWTGEEWNFVVKTGRVLVHPIFLGSMDRSDGFRYRLQDDTRAYREHVIAWGREVGRTLDYLETRDDMNHDAIGYYGFSWGARMGGIMLAIHDRLRTAVLHSGGLSPIPVQPEADPFNYLPRVAQPVLMLNSRFENVYPLATSARPFLDNLGTPEDLKHLEVTDGGHFIARNTLVRETLAWFDRHLSGN